MRKNEVVKKKEQERYSRLYLRHRKWGSIMKSSDTVSPVKKEERQCQQKVALRIRIRISQQNIWRNIWRTKHLQFIILPLAQVGVEEKQNCIQRCFEMVKTIEDEQEQVFLLSGMLVFSDKVIRSEDSKKMRNWIMMKKIGKMFEEEKLEYAKEQIVKNNKKIALCLLKRGDALEEVSRVLPQLTLDELFELSEEVKKEKK